MYDYQKHFRSEMENEVLCHFYVHIFPVVYALIIRKNIYFLQCRFLHLHHNNKTAETLFAITNKVLTTIIIGLIFPPPRLLPTFLSSSFSSFVNEKVQTTLTKRENENCSIIPIHSTPKLNLLSIKFRCNNNWDLRYFSQQK